MNKRLTIRNRNKIVGREFQVPGNSDKWTIYAAVQEEDAYGFRCEGHNGGVDICVELSRIGEPITEGGKIIYVFPFRGGGSHSITADWFADMDNAVSAIAERVNYLNYI